MTTPEQFLNQQHYETPRNGRGQYLMADESGHVAPRTRATTFADTLANPFSLHQWKMRVVAKGMSLRPDLVAVAASTHIEDKKAFADVVEAAFDRGGGNDAARQGTALHAFVTGLANGQLTENDVPADMIHDVHAYFRELARLGITEDTAYMERAVYNGTYDVGGTFDRIYTLADGSRVIGDIKTGADLSFGEHEFAVQLALYAHADIMFQPGSAELGEPMPDVRRDFALLIHVPQGRGEAHVERIDIGLGWWAARVCAEARTWRSTKTIRTPYHPGNSQPEPSTMYPNGGTDPFEQPWLPSNIAPASTRCKSTVDAPIEWSASFDGKLSDEGAKALVKVGMTNEQGQVIPLQPIETVYDPEHGGEVQLDKPQYGQAQKTDANFDAEADQLFVKLKKAKPKIQDLARRVMKGGLDIKLNTYGINICKAIVRHPNWPAFAAENNWTIPDPTPKVAVATENGSIDRSTLSPQTQQIMANVDAIKSFGMSGNDVVNPFNSTSTPVAPGLFDEVYYLNQVDQAESKEALAALWQHAQDHNQPWTDALNAAGLMRMQVLRAIELK